MMMPGRTYSAQSSYRYGFNGKENDNEVKGEGNEQDYGMRIYDPRLGKFLSVDPLIKKYPELTPYQFASNRPIDGIDLDGLEYVNYRTSMYRMQATTKSTFDFGKGIKLVTTYHYVANTVYSNIPAALQDPQTNSFKFVGDGPVTGYGRDWDEAKDGPIFTPKNYYHGNGPKFYGLPEEADPDPSDATKPVGSYYGDDPMSGSSGPAKANATANAIGEIGKLALNFSNGDEWAAIGDERRLRWGFYDATNMVNSYIQNNNIGIRSLTSGSGKADLVNFMTDGTLPIDGHARNKDTRKNMYRHALDVALTGAHLMKEQGITIQKETISSINSTIKRYKKSGGGNEYDNIKKYLNQ